MAAAAYITPDMLTWARKRCGFSEYDIAQGLGVDVENVLAWEAGKKRPAMGDARNFAQKTHIPFGYLYLKEPPELPLPVADFRRGIGDKTTEDEVNLHAFVSDALHKKEWYEAYLKETGTNYRSEDYQSRFSVHDSNSEIAAFIDSFLEMKPPGDNNQRGNTHDFWTSLWKGACRAGLWVMRAGYAGTSTRRTISESACRGFALKSEYKPVIWVNSRLSDAAKSFTIIHEIAHILLDSEGLSNFNSEDGEGVQKYNDIEKKCDEIAANVLIAENVFSQFWSENYDTLTNLERTHNVFSVSKFALLRRAHETQKISADEYGKQRSILVSQIPAQRQNSGGNSNYNLLARNGWDFTNAVLCELMEGNITYPDAKGLLNVASHTRLDKLYDEMREGKYASPY